MTGLATNEGTERAVALRSALAERVVVADVAMGTMLQASEATDAIVIHHPEAKYLSV